VHSRIRRRRGHRVSRPDKRCRHIHVVGRLGTERRSKLWADWTDRIAAGELPFASQSGRKVMSEQRGPHPVGLEPPYGLPAR